MLGQTYKNYSGETIVTKMSLSKGMREQETVDYTMSYRPSGIPAAVVCGNGLSRRKFKMLQLVEAAGGILRQNKPEVYACNAAYTESAKPHNLIISNKAMAEEFYNQTKEYPESVFLPWNIWTNHRDQTNPAPRLIPNKVIGCAGAMALYLAAWHGHSTIYMVGFDLQPEEGRNNNVYAGKHPLYKDVEEHVSDAGWIAECLRIMQAYPDTKFVRIVPTVQDNDQNKIVIQNFNCPDEWADLDNFRQLDSETFKTELDLDPVKDHTRRQLFYRSTGPRVS